MTIRQLIDQATPLPWTACTWDSMERPHIYKTVEEHNHGHDVAQNMTRPDARLMVAAVNRLPTYERLLEAVGDLLRHCEKQHKCDGEEWTVAWAYHNELTQPVDSSP